MDRVMQVPKKARRKVRWWVVLSVVLGVIILGMGVTVLALEPGLREARDLTITEVDFANLRDGIFEGAYKGTRDSTRDTKVQVTVASGKVGVIRVVEGVMANEKSVRLMHDLLDSVVEKQSLQVNAVSGATISSKVLLKAIENALTQAAAR